MSVAFLGGVASVLTPCVLPILPALLAVSAGEGRRRVAGIVIGLELSFFLVGIALAGVVSAAGLPTSALQWVAAALLVAFGSTLIVPALHERFQRVVSRVTSPVASAIPRRAGFGGGLLAGAPLGLIWTPCAGPILAGITVAGATTRFTGRTVAIMAAYGLGMLGPLLAIAFGGRRAAESLRRKVKSPRRVEVVMGGVLLLTAAMVGFGWVNSVNRFLAESIDLTSTPTAALERRALARGAFEDEGAARLHLTEDELEANGYPEVERLADYGPAHDFTGITRWFNSDDLSLGDLRGKVVLVDFWTYSCINCIRTFPYLKDWYSDYSGDGFVIVGVHTPEFAFEKDADNVAAAIDDFGIEYPVGMDNDYATWDGYYNHYWPAHYLIDRSGTLRSVHYGEGAYERTENEIRHLLSLPVDDEAEDAEDFGPPRTPETYLGYLRAERFVGTTGGRAGVLAADETVEYELPGDLPLHAWALEGTWTVGRESAVAGDGAAIDLHYLARDVHIVVGPEAEDAAGTMTVRSDDGTEVITVDEHRLYTVRSGPHETGVLRLELSPGLQAYAFTFG